MADSATVTIGTEAIIGICAFAGFALSGVLFRYLRLVTTKVNRNNGSVSIGDRKIIVNGGGRNITMVNGRLICGTRVIEDVGLANITVIIHDGAGSVNLDSGNITVNGEVSGDIRCSSGNVNIAGNVTGNASSSSGNIKCHEVGGSVSCGSGNIIYRGKK